MPSSSRQLVPVVSNMVLRIDIFQGIVSKLEFHRRGDQTLNNEKIKTIK